MHATNDVGMDLGRVYSTPPFKKRHIVPARLITDYEYADSPSLLWSKKSNHFLAKWSQSPTLPPSSSAGPDAMFSRLIRYLCAKTISFAKSLCSRPDINPDEFERVEDRDIWACESRQIWDSSVASVPKDVWTGRPKRPLPIPEPTMTQLKQ
jgi:hypothetical protein